MINDLFLSIGSLRFSTDEHPAIKEFKGLIKEGADIDIGIPYDLWDRYELNLAL